MSHTEQGERLVHIANEHWIRLILPVVIGSAMFLISLLLIFLAGISVHHYLWLSHVTFIAGMILFLLTHHWFFMMLLSESLDKIIITNKRLFRVQYRLILKEDILEVSFEKMKTVDVIKTGLLQNILRYGTLTFESKLASVPYVHHPNDMARIIQEAMRMK